MAKGDLVIPQTPRIAYAQMAGNLLAYPPRSFVAFQVSPLYHDYIWGNIAKWEEQHRAGKADAPDYYLLFGKPRRPKSTGPNSVNNHAWGHARQLAGYLGYADVERFFYEVILSYAAAEPWEYPCEMVIKTLIPQSWALATSAEAGRVVDCEHYIAAVECDGLELIEKEWGE